MSLPANASPANLATFRDERPFPNAIITTKAITEYRWDGIRDPAPGSQFFLPPKSTLTEEPKANPLMA